MSEFVWLCRVRWHVQHWQFQLWAIYVWLCRDFDFHTEQFSAENHPNFRRIQTGLLCRGRSNIFIRVKTYEICSSAIKKVEHYKHVKIHWQTYCMNFALLLAFFSFWRCWTFNFFGYFRNVPSNKLFKHGMGVCLMNFH